jgi:C4-dicarboxylate-specific signal transduction histidine kinase
LAIIGLANEVLKEYFTKHKDVSFENEAVHGIEEQINRASAIITNMRTFARSGRDDMELVNLQEPIDLALSFFKEQFRLHDINLSFTYDENLPRVKANAQKIEQVMVNLVSNSRYAVEKKAAAAPDGYEMEISIQLYRDPDRHAVILEVSDNGIGMTAKEREHCLEPFFTRKKVGEGTGLGLSITHNIVNEIGGTIKIDSEENKGCTFAIMIQETEDND